IPAPVFSADGRLMVVQTLGFLQIRDAASNRVLHEERPDTSFEIVFPEGGRRRVLGISHGLVGGHHVREWALPDPGSDAPTVRPVPSASSLALSPDGSRVAVGTWSGGAAREGAVTVYPTEGRAASEPFARWGGTQTNLGNRLGIAFNQDA